MKAPKPSKADKNKLSPEHINCVGCGDRMAVYGTEPSRFCVACAGEPRVGWYGTPDSYIVESQLVYDGDRFTQV